MVTSLGALVTWKKQEDNAKQAGGVKAPLRVSGCKKVALNTQKLQMQLFVLILSIKDIGRAVDKGLVSIRRGVTLEYDEANGFKFRIGDGTGCTTLQEHTIGDAPPQKLCLSSDCNTGNGLPVTGMDVSPSPSPPLSPPSHNPPPPPYFFSSTFGLSSHFQ